MDSRASDIRRGNSVPKPINPHQQVLEVAPLNSVPYIGPPAPFGDRVGSSTPGVQSQTHRVESPTQGDVDAKPAEAGPSMVFFPSQTTQKGWMISWILPEVELGWLGVLQREMWDQLWVQWTLAKAMMPTCFESLFLEFQGMKKISVVTLILMARCS